jgi:hypothetical protein
MLTVYPNMADNQQKNAQPEQEQYVPPAMANTCAALLTKITPAPLSRVETKRFIMLNVAEQHLRISTSTRTFRQCRNLLLDHIIRHISDHAQDQESS